MSARGKRLTSEEFITKASIIHVNKFDYSLVEYKNSQTKIKIICPVHGDFEQLPLDHLKGFGCGLCSKRGVALSPDVMILRIQEQLGSKFDYSKVEYVNRNTKITIICPEHGEFAITPHAILTQNQGCKKCGLARASLNKRTPIDEFVKKANELHNNKYEYNEVVYVNNSTKIQIVCPTHGEFWQRPDNHILQGRGCPGCKREKARENAGGYTIAYFENHPDQQIIPAILYSALIINGNERFIKIGITAKSTKHRFNRSEYKNMNIEVLHEKNLTLFEAFQIEQQFIEDMKPHKFFSNTTFSGYTECFRINDVVVNRINDIFRIDIG